MNNNDLILTIILCSCAFLFVIVISIVALLWSYKGQISYILVIWKLLKEIWDLLFKKPETRSPKPVSKKVTKDKKPKEVEDAEFREIDNR